MQSLSYKEIQNLKYFLKKTHKTMGNCTGCEDQQTLEQRNEIFFDKSKKRCNENMKLMRSSKKFEGKENKENKEPSTSNSSGKPPLKPVALTEKSINISIPIPLKNDEKKEKYPKIEAPIYNEKEEARYEEDCAKAPLKQKAPLQPDVCENTEESDHIPNHLRKLEEMPNYLNEHTQAVLEKLGKFKYS